MPRPKKQIFDPLIQAMIDRLPKPGGAFPAKERVRWLALMKANMDLVYGGGENDIPITGQDLFEPSPQPAQAEPTKPAKKFKKNIMHDFYIDYDDKVYGKGAKRLNPDQVTGVLVDLRGPDANPDTITWADDTTGLKGDIITALA